jgi:rhodanese-related sulfurtransferase
MTATISPRQLAELCSKNKNLELIDVRTPVEFREIHVDFARNVPLDRLNPQSITASRDSRSGEPLYVICRSGNRAKQACELLAAAGTPVVNVEGGTLAWEAAGLPVVRGRKAISLERQVRIVAGFLVLVGAILAIAVHPYFVGLSAFVGAGLMFAGITDTCGMGLLLAKMPWNQIPRETPSATCKV